MRADDGNRTRMTSLEGWGSTIELHPRGLPAQAGTHVAYRLAPVSRTPARGHLKAKPQPSSRTVPCSTPRSPAPRPRRHPRTPYGTPAPVAQRAPPDDPWTNLGTPAVRLADGCPKASIQPLQVPLARAPLDPRVVLTWPVMPTSRCHVRIPDITGQSHLRPVPRLALDTRRRNGHASDQVQ
jgi:hypothetical protein